MMSQRTRYGFSREAGQKHRPVPLVRRPVAYRGLWPIHSHRTLAEVDWPDAPLPDDFEIPAGDNPQADDASGLEGSAPEGTSGALAGTKEHLVPANADQSRLKSRAKAGDEVAGTEHASPCPATEPVSRPAAGRSAAATSEPMDVTAGETAPHPDPKPQPVDPLPAAAVAPALPVARCDAAGSNRVARAAAVALSEEDAAEEFAAALDRVRSRRAGEASEIRKPAPHIDYARVAAAARARSIAARPVPKAPTRPALSADPCEKCGVPGFRGCAHQLPYADYTPAAARDDDDCEDLRKPGKQGQNWLKSRTFRI